MSKTTPPTIRAHHLLVSAHIVFSVRDDGGEEAISETNINGLVVTDEENIKFKTLAKAQMVVQKTLFEKLGADAARTTIRNVTILNIVKLGYMTDAEFNAAPAAEENPFTKLVGDTDGFLA